MALITTAVSSFRRAVTGFPPRYNGTLNSVWIITRKNHQEVTSDASNYNMIITGGGMVGTTLAVALG